MPSVSKSQQRLMAAAEHGADFPAAERLRKTMSQTQLHEFATGSMKEKPEHTSDDVARKVNLPVLISGDSRDIVHSNVNVLKNTGLSELEATKRAIKHAKPRKSMHGNLGNFLHPRKDGKPHGSDKDF